MKKKKRERRKQQVVQPKLQSKREKEICLKKEKDRKIKYKIIKEKRELNKKKRVYFVISSNYSESIHMKDFQKFTSRISKTHFIYFKVPFTMHLARAVNEPSLSE